MGIIGMQFETRCGCKTFVKMGDSFSMQMKYTPSQIPRLEIVCGNDFIRLYTGAVYPCEMYEPRFDTISVEIFFEDGHVETPFARGRVDLCDLYDFLIENLVHHSEDANSDIHQNTQKNISPKE